MFDANSADDRLALSITEAARLLGVGRTTVYQELIDTGQLRTVKIGTRRLVPVSEIHAFLAKQLAAEAPREPAPPCPTQPRSRGNPNKPRHAP